MREEYYSPQASRLLKQFFLQCQSNLESEETIVILEKLELGIKDLRAGQRRGLFLLLRKICLKLSVSASIRKTSDLARIIVGAALWSYAIREYAMSMGSSQKIRENIWKEVEEISWLQKDEVFAISSFLEHLANQV